MVELELLVISLGDGELDDVEVRVREVGVGESVAEPVSWFDLVGEEVSIVCERREETRRSSAREKREGDSVDHTDRC